MHTFSQTRCTVCVTLKKNLSAKETFGTQHFVLKYLVFGLKLFHQLITVVDLHWNAAHHVAKALSNSVSRPHPTALFYRLWKHSFNDKAPLQFSLYTNSPCTAAWELRNSTSDLRWLHAGLLNRAEFFSGSTRGLDNVKGRKSSKSPCRE